MRPCLRPRGQNCPGVDNHCQTPQTLALRSSNSQSPAPAPWVHLGSTRLQVPTTTGYLGRKGKNVKPRGTQHLVGGSLENPLSSLLHSSHPPPTSTQDSFHTEIWPALRLPEILQVCTWLFTLYSSPGQNTHHLTSDGKGNHPHTTSEGLRTRM